MLTLYHAPQSRSSRILWLLEELGAPCEIVYVDIQRMDGSGGLDPRNPHPDRKVPALVHDGALITESAAVVLYLTDLFPKAGVGRAIGDPQRGPYLSWLAYYAGVIEPVVHFGFFGLGEHEGLRRTFRGRAELDRRILGALEKQPYVLGDKFSGADILVASMGHFRRDMLPAGRTIDDYIERCSARPALARAMAKDAKPAGK
jgi:glutathione S-transferase